MTDDSRKDISPNTEITEGFGLHHFLAAVSWGSIAGTGAMMAMMIVSGLGFDLAAIGTALVFTGFFAGIITLLAMLVIGLPLTLILGAIDRESAVLYASFGSLVGYLVLGLMIGLPSKGQAEALLFPLLGAFAGWACALRWGKWREKCADRRLPAPKSTSSSRRNNPVHDLIH
jgi:hypothetical protein